MPRLGSASRDLLPPCVTLAIVVLTTTCSAVHSTGPAAAAAFTNPAPQPAQSGPSADGPASAPPLEITTTALHLGDVGRGYNAVLGATGGTAPYLWTASAGELLLGVELNSETGQLTGMPT